MAATAAPPVDPAVPPPPPPGPAPHPGRWQPWHTVGSLVIIALIIALAIWAATSNTLLTDLNGKLPVWTFLGLAALLLARRALRRTERTLGRSGGEGAARAGRVLGVIGLCLAASAAIAIGFYGLLVHYQ